MTYEILCWLITISFLILLILYIINLHYEISYKGWTRGELDEMSKDFKEQSDINFKLNEELKKREKSDKK